MTILNKTSQKPYFFKIFGCFFIFIKFVSILLCQSLWKLLF